MGRYPGPPGKRNHEESYNRFAKNPDYLTYEEASTLPCAGLTAWNALVVRGQLQAGETIVIQGTGGVALFALQLAKTIGARVILLSSDDEKLEKAGRMGADELINFYMEDILHRRIDLIAGFNYSMHRLHFGIKSAAILISGDEHHSG